MTLIKLGFLRFGWAQSSAPMVGSDATPKQNTVIEGRGTIVSALLTSLGTLNTMHSVSNPRVTIDGDTARMHVLVEA